MKRLMIVDDEILVRVGLKSILNWEENGFTVIAEAADGIEAMEKIEKLKPDIVLTDLVMNGMDGFQLIEECTRLYPSIKFIVLSSYNDFYNVRSAMKIGAVDYFFKLTTDPHSLLEILKEVSQQIDKEAGQNKQDSDSTSDLLIRKNIPAIKGNLLKKVIQQAYLDYGELMKEFSLLELSTDFTKKYMVLYISMDDLDESSGGYDLESEQQLLKFSMENMVSEIIKKTHTAEVYNYDRGDLIVIIQPEETENEEELVQQVEKDFDTIQVYTKRYLGYGVSAFASMPACGVENFRKIIANAEKRMYGRLAVERGRLLFNEEGIREEIVKIKQYVRTHLSENFTVSTVAALVNMSESYFSHSFKKEVGINFTDYVNRVRIEKAVELLEKSNLKVNEIADQVGIYNTNYFSTLFKKKTGKSPNQYRQDFVGKGG